MRIEAGLSFDGLLSVLTSHGSVDVVDAMIEGDEPVEIFTLLKRAGRLDLTVEAFLVENPKWHSLFTPDIVAKARERLAAHGYKRAMN